MLGGSPWKHRLPEQLCQPGFPRKDGKASREPLANPRASFQGTTPKSKAHRKPNPERKEMTMEKEEKKRKQGNLEGQGGLRDILSEDRFCFSRAGVHLRVGGQLADVGRQFGACFPFSEDSSFPSPDPEPSLELLMVLKYILMYVLLLINLFPS